MGIYKKLCFLKIIILFVSMISLSYSMNKEKNNQQQQKVYCISHSNFPVSVVAYFRCKKVTIQVLC